MIDKFRDFLQFEIKFVVESLLGLVLILTLVEILLGPLLSSEFYLIQLVNSLNNGTGFILLLVLLGTYAWATEQD